MSGRPANTVKSLTRRELYNAIKPELGSLKAAQEVVNAYFTEIECALANGRTVTIANLGRFSTLTKKQREGRNPRSGEIKKIRARTVATFRPSLKLRGSARLFSVPNCEDGKSES